MINSATITIDITDTTWAELRRFVRLADELGVADGDGVRVERPDGYAAVYELRIESVQMDGAGRDE